MNFIEIVSNYLSDILFKKQEKSGFVPTTDLDKKIIPDLSGLPEKYQQAIKNSGTISAPTGKSIDLKTANPIQYANIKAQESKEAQKKVTEFGKTILRAPGRALASFVIEGENKAPETITRQILFGDQPIDRGFTPQTALQKFIFGEEEVLKSSVAYQETKKQIEPTFGKASMPIAGTAVFGGLLLDLTPFGGSEKKLAETLAKEGSESVVRNLMKEAKFTDDLIEKYAPLFAKEKDIMKINQTIKAIKASPGIDNVTKKIQDNVKGYQTFGGAGVGTEAPNAYLRDLNVLTKTDEGKVIAKKSIDDAISRGEIVPDANGKITLYRVGEVSDKNDLISATYDKSFAQGFDRTGKAKITKIKVNPDDIRYNIGGVEKEVLVDKSVFKGEVLPKTNDLTWAKGTRAGGIQNAGLKNYNQATKVLENAGELPKEIKAEKITEDFVKNYYQTKKPPVIGDVFINAKGERIEITKIDDNSVRYFLKGKNKGIEGKIYAGENKFMSALTPLPQPQKAPSVGLESKIAPELAKDTYGTVKEWGTRNQYVANNPYRKQLDAMKKTKNFDMEVLKDAERWEMQQVLKDKPAFLSNNLSKEEITAFAKKNKLWFRSNGNDMVVAKDIDSLNRTLNAMDSGNQRELGLALGYEDLGIPSKVATKKALPEEGRGLKERQFVKTVKEAPATKEEVKKGLDELDNYYTPQGNKELVQEADDLIKNNIDEAVRIVKSPTVSAKSNIIAQKLVIEYQNAKRYEDAIDIVENISKKATNQGQAIQALSIFNKLTPEGVLRYTQKILDKANVGRKTPLKLNPKKAEEIIEQATKVSKLPEGRKKVVETARLVEKVLEQVPPSLGTKIATLQTMAQLLNPKTFIRNIVGNLGFGIAENIKDIIATPLDSAMSLITKKRTTTLPSIRTQLGGFKKGLAEGVEDALQRVNTSMVNTQFDLPKTRVFQGRVGQSLEKLLNLELRATDRAFYQSAYDGSLYQQLKATGLDNPTEEMKEVAHFDALYKTFQDDNVVSKMFVGIKKAFNNIGIKDFGMGDFVLKYPKTPANLLARGIEYSPGGFVNTLYEAIRPLLGKPFNQKKFVESFSRAMLGSGALVGAGALLHRLGIISGKPEKDTDIKGIQRISGLGQYRINYSALKRFLFSGLNPETAKLQPNDMLISYDWFQPMAIPLSMGANIDEGGGAKGQVISAIQSMTEGINTLGEQPLVSGFRRIMLTKDIASSVEESLKGIPSSFIPIFLSQINQLIDNTQRNSYDPSTYQYALNLAKAKIPGLAQTLPASIDVFGEDLERYQGDTNNLFNVFFNPSFTSWYKPTPEAKMVLDIMDTTGETKHSPRVVGKTYTINGESKKLNPKQITAMQRYVGTITKELFSSFASDNKFQALPPDEKIKYLSNVLSDIGSAGKIVILGDRPKKPSKDVLNIIKIFNGQR